MRIVVGLGGNALIRRGEPADLATQRAHVEGAVAGLAELAIGHEVVIAHGNDPQVGHLLEMALRNRLPDREIVTVLTETIVDREPQAISELPALRLLVESGALVICAAGSIPVALGAAGMLQGVEGVVDRDLTAALLARRLEADLLLMLTDIDAVYLGWGVADEHPLRQVQADQLREVPFAAGSIGPKVEAACRFAESTGKPAAIGALADAVRIVRGEKGTRVVPAGVLV